MSIASINGFAARPVNGPAVSATGPWWETAYLFTALFAITVAVWAMDERVLSGVSVWAKPLKFQVSLALHFATLAALAHLLPARRLSSRGFRTIVHTTTAAGLFEITYIMLQASRARASHFNDQTVFEMLMYTLMGLGALVLVLGPLTMGAWLLRDHRRWLHSNPLVLASGLGLILSAVATLVVAGYMSMLGSHWVGQVHSAAGSLPLLGWSQQVGDLRVPHFFATHAMQLLPLAGLLLQNAGRSGSRWVLTGSVAYALFTAAVFVQALNGQPFAVVPGF